MSKKNHKAELIIEKNESDPPGKAKLADAMRALLETKDFGSITTAELSKTAGANEALIYRYFSSKRGLLHQVTEDYLKASLEHLQEEINNEEGVKNKLKCFVSNTFRIYDSNRVFAKIILLEARNFPGFFQSLSYDAVKAYSKLLSDIVQKGLDEGIFRKDLDLKFIRDFIIGSIEHYIMPDVIFKRNMDPERYTDNLCKIAFEGIVKTAQPAVPG